MKQYMLAVHGVDGVPPPPPAEMIEIYRDVDILNKEMQQNGVWIFGGGLEEPKRARVAKSREGKIGFTDGPFAETKEHLGGFWIIKAPNIEAALEWAAKATVACRAPVEVRAFQEPPA